MATAGKKGDAEMLLAYTDSLRQKFFSNLDANTEAFYAVPISNVGIPIGEGIAQEKTNQGVFDCGDPSPLLSRPLYGASNQGYNLRAVKYLGAVSLRSSTNKGAVIRLAEAKAKSAKLQAEFAALQAKALEAYNSDEDKRNMTFRQWQPRQYPILSSLGQELQAANSTEASLRAQVEGRDADSFVRLKSSAFAASDIANPYAGLNMPVTNYKPNTENAIITYRPAYAIAGDYAAAVQGWKQQAGSGSSQGISISYNLQNAQNTSWAANGFQNVSSGGDTGCPPFFRAQWTYQGKSQGETISAEEVGSNLNVQLKAAGMAAFSVARGQWDVPEMDQTYKTLEMTSTSTFPAVCKVTDVLMGYNVSMEIQLSTEVKNRIQQIASKVGEAGGEIGFFGRTFWLGRDSAGTLMQKMFNEAGSTSIQVPSIDVGYPVLMGVKGKKLPEVKVAAVR